MKGWKKYLAVLLCVSALTACYAQPEEEPIPVPEPYYPEQEQPVDPEMKDRTGMPTIPEGIPADMEYLFDFSFSERYDDKIQAEFSLDFSGAGEFDAAVLALYEPYRDETGEPEVFDYPGEGMTPYSIRRYFYPDGLIVGTDRYEADNVEYIDYLWTNMEGAKTDAGIGVGSTEQEIMAAYPSSLYYIPGDQTEEDLLSFTESTAFQLEFDYALAWQPFTTESNECRDITFYIKNGEVTSIEMMEPFELRYVYGFDGGPDLAAARNQ